MSHTSFATTTRGLNRDLPPMRLYEKAKKLGIWNPSDIDFSKDKQDWSRFTDEEKDLCLLLLSMFVAGEEAVTLDLLPLIQAIAQEGRLEEEMFLTTFLFEEAKHTDFFRRFMDEVAEAGVDLSRYHGDNYHQLFYEALPSALNALRTDASPANQIAASVTYNMVVEGVLAETGYQAFFTMLERNDLMPGLRKGISLLKQDESRHIAYGVYLLSRLIAEHPQEWDNLQMQMNMLLPSAIGVIGDAFARYKVVPFGLVEEDFVNYAMSQFSKRFERLEKAKGQSLDEINRTTKQIIESGDS
ncbi:MAG: R2-like ligand-binding oxidase [Anaerolineales bacterium]|uniref:R2-like ligand-binding oxidase n=1 Tax=Candidatus Villigracilis proximus TaxID=3140683 RepID=UPI003136C68B|nr:R2-like ligand-binding oxidase [Anaerolineales bacterium]MBK9208242.1 R2-like ligand-binding oxidase [Anaerolineales bacterium]